MCALAPSFYARSGVHFGFLIRAWWRLKIRNRAFKRLPLFPFLSRLAIVLEDHDDRAPHDIEISQARFLAKLVYPDARIE